jgi:cell division protein FtsB
MSASHNTDTRDTADRGTTLRRHRRPFGGAQGRRFWSHVVLFLASALLVNGLIGEHGLMETIRARRAFAAAARDLARLKQENAGLRDQARRLRSDPATIESVARGELGLVRPGEVLVTVKDLK